MRFKDIAVLNEDFSVSYGMDVRIEGSRIARVAESRSSDCVPDAHDHIIDGRGKLLMPGFYNAHAHAPMTLLRGYAENMLLSDWLEKKVFPFENLLNGDDCFYATMLSMAESFANGIVSSSDQYFFCGDIVRAAVCSGAKMNVSRGLSFFGEDLNPAQFRPYRESMQLFDDHHDTENGRIRVDIGLHAEYTATTELLGAVAALSRETGAPVHVHVSETSGEHDACKERHGGRTPVRVLADSGVFDRGGIAAHCVWLEGDDADILKEKGVTAVTCSVSNMKLAGGIADIPSLLEKGLNVALGTDGAASNNSLNFFEEMKLMALGAKVRFGDPTLITPQQALYAATRAGALAQGRTDCGYVKEGFRADMIALDLNSPALNPVHDMASSLVYSASNRDIIMTIIDGNVVYENGVFPTIDIEKMRAAADRARVRILGDLARG